MKHWIIIISVILIIAAGIIVINQTQVEAQTAPTIPTAVIIMHCKTDGKDINVVSSSYGGSSPSSTKPNAGSSCASSLLELLKKKFEIKSSESDSSGTFNYTLVK